MHLERKEVRRQSSAEYEDSRYENRSRKCEVGVENAERISGNMYNK